LHRNNSAARPEYVPCLSNTRARSPISAASRHMVGNLWSMNALDSSAAGLTPLLGKPPTSPLRLADALDNIVRQKEIRLKQTTIMQQRNGHKLFASNLVWDKTSGRQVKQPQETLSSFLQTRHVFSRKTIMKRQKLDTVVRKIAEPACFLVDFLKSCMFSRRFLRRFSPLVQVFVQVFDKAPGFFAGFFAGFCGKTIFCSTTWLTEEINTYRRSLYPNTSLLRAQSRISAV